jgi:hypothetical protein
MAKSAWPFETWVEPDGREGNLTPMDPHRHEETIGREAGTGVQPQPKTHL